MNRKTHLSLAIAAAAFISTVALAPNANAQSFNCNYAKSADEVAICNSPRLSSLDQQMSRAYYAVRNTLYGSYRVRLEAQQAAWLSSRKRCGNSPSCIANSYYNRIEELQAWEEE